MKFCDYSGFQINWVEKYIFLSLYILLELTEMLVIIKMQTVFSIHFYTLTMWISVVLSTYKTVSCTWSHSTLRRKRGSMRVIFWVEWLSLWFSQKFWFWVPYNCFVELCHGGVCIPKICSQINEQYIQPERVLPLPNMLLKFPFPWTSYWVSLLVS